MLRSASSWANERYSDRSRFSGGVRKLAAAGKSKCLGARSAWAKREGGRGVKDVSGGEGRQEDVERS